MAVRAATISVAVGERPPRGLGGVEDDGAAVGGALPDTVPAWGCAGAVPLDADPGSGEPAAWVTAGFGGDDGRKLPSWVRGSDRGGE